MPDDEHIANYLKAAEYIDAKIADLKMAAAELRQVAESLAALADGAGPLWADGDLEPPISSTEEAR